MKLSALKTDSARLEQGRWVDNIPEMEELRLHVRGFGNADYRRLTSKMVDAVPRSKRPGGRLDPDEQDRISAQCMLDTILLGWDGLTGEDGKPVPYTRELATTLLTDSDYIRFRNAVAYAATVVADEADASAGDDQGN